VVDSVAIDAAYDGAAFDVDLIDVPERKSDVVSGAYEVDIPAGSDLPIAVRITDMLGGKW
jgi:adenine-specific DNA-methyltransferase